MWNICLYKKDFTALYVMIYETLDIIITIYILNHFISLSKRKYYPYMYESIIIKPRYTSINQIYIHFIYNKHIYKSFHQTSINISKVTKYYSYMYISIIITHRYTSNNKFS